MTLQTFSGSCLCGTVSFEITGEARNFLHCHCGRCRKATGTGHASNIIVGVDALRWTSGETELRRYDVPGAERFHSHFCGSCGSPMPRVAADGGTAVIPAGSLDQDPQIAPAGRIFQDSRASWSCQDDVLPAWDQYPAPQA